MRTFQRLLCLALVVLVGTVACSKKSSDDASSAVLTPQNGTIETPADADNVKMVITADDAMQFDVKKITVHEGQTIELTLKHTGSGSIETMGHNFVLLKAGDSPAAFAKVAMAAEDTDYIPQDSDEIIAHTKLLAGGESDTITFEAPPKGEYHFMCTFPGHFAMMQGTFTVE